MSEAPAVTIETLSRAKKIPTDLLRAYGVLDCPDGVLFAYRLPNGGPGRTRLRSALRGSDGCTWREFDTRPITAYTPPEQVKFDNPFVLQIVEGESDCWTAWSLGFRAIGIPGSDQVGVLESEHVQGIATVFIQRENIEAANKTYPNGVAHFVAAVAARLGGIGYCGEVRVLRVPGRFSDMSDMYVDAPAAFAKRLKDAMAHSVQYSL